MFVNVHVQSDLDDAPDQVAAWNSTKETFRKPLSLYQELLNNMYFHLLAKVDEYNLLMKAASDVYVGVKGPFNVGSALVPKDLRELPLKKYVPRSDCGPSPSTLAAARLTSSADCFTCAKARAASAYTSPIDEPGRMSWNCWTRSVFQVRSSCAPG